MIEFDHVSMAYQLSEDLALKNVSFKVERGEFVFIIGSSGSGKSTIIKLLTCEERPLKGEIIVNGFSLNTIKKKQIPYLRRNIGMVFQDFRLIPSKTVFENVSYAMEIVGASRRAILHQVPMVLSIVGLRNRQSAYPYELSGGEQQRVAIARAMVNKPMMILADEPTGNLDPVNSESIMALLAEINKSGTTVLVCSHDKDLVNRMKKRVILIDDGMKIRDDNEGTFYAEDTYSNAPQPSVTESTSVSATESMPVSATEAMPASATESTPVSATASTPVSATASRQLAAQELTVALDENLAMVKEATKFEREAGLGQAETASRQNKAIFSQIQTAAKRVEADAMAAAASNVARANSKAPQAQAAMPQAQATMPIAQSAIPQAQATIPQAQAASPRFNVSRVNSARQAVSNETRFNKAATNEQALSWTQSIHRSLYHEDAAPDDKLFAIPGDEQYSDADYLAEPTLQDTTDGSSKNKRSSLSSERIERWGKRRF